MYARMHEEGPREGFLCRSLSHVHGSLSLCAPQSLSPSRLPLSARAFSQPVGPATLSLGDLTPAHLVDSQSIWQGVMEPCRKALTNR